MGISLSGFGSSSTLQNFITVRRFGNMVNIPIDGTEVNAGWTIGGQQVYTRAWGTIEGTADNTLVTSDLTPLNTKLLNVNFRWSDSGNDYQAAHSVDGSTTNYIFVRLYDDGLKIKRSHTRTVTDLIIEYTKV